MKKQSFTFISRSSPYGSNRAQLCLDAAFAAAVFEQEVNYLFIGDGLYQLLKEQNAEDIEHKTLGRALETLDLYGIENVYVLADDMKKRNLVSDDLVVPVQTLDSAKASSLISNSAHVINL